MRPLRRLALSAAIVVVSTTVSGGGLALASGPAPAFGYGTPTFVNSAAPLSDGTQFFNSDGAGEPSIGIDWQTGNAMYQAATDTYQLSFSNSTTAPSVTWHDVTSPYSLFSLDPILATDTVTGATLAGADNGACGGMSLTTNDGGTSPADPTSWTPTEPCPGTIDHPTVGFGPAVGPLAPLALNGRVAYYCQQEDLVDECVHSLDDGQTWSHSVADTSITCDYLFGHVKAGPDGTAYIPNSNCFDANGTPTVGGLMTTDSGLTLTHYLIPGAPTPARGFDPSVAVASDNTVYQAWERDGDYHPVVTVSHDHGTTWAPQIDLAQTVTPALSGASFAAAVAGDGGASGRAAVAFLGTWAHTDGLTPYDAGYHGVWYLFVSYTYDGGRTWQTVQATPNPVQRGYIDDGGLNPTNPSGGGTQRNLLDFIDASMTKDGHVAVAYADGCTGVCDGPSGTEAESVDSRANVAYQATGRGLLSAYDVKPVTAPAAPTLTASTASGHVDLSWTTPDDGGSPITGYQVLRGSTSGGESLLATVPATATTYSDLTATAGSTYFYEVAAVNAVGTGSPSNEVVATAPSTPSAPAATANDGNGKVLLSWTPGSNGGSTITGYQISRGLSPGAETPYATVGAVSSFADAAVSAGTAYYYTVAATNAVGTGAGSGEVSATPTTVPSAPTLTATAGKSGVTLSWTTPASGGAPITGWSIYRATTSGAEQLVQTLSTGTTYVDTTVTGGLTYYYEVAATNRDGTGAVSREASATARKH